MLLKITIAFVLLFLSSTSALGEQPLTPFKFQRYTVDNGLSQGTILSMHQDKKGFLWLGTENGLNRFDGYDFVQFKSLKGHDVRAIAESADGDLWVGTTDALNVLPSGQEKFEFVAMAFATSTQSKNIQSLTFDASGVLWIGTAQGLFKKNLSTGLSTGHNTDIEKVNLLQYQTNDASDFIVSITEVSPGIMWIGTDNGVIEINNVAKTQQLILFNGNNNKIHIRAVFKNSKNDIWIATFGHGLFQMQYNNKDVTRYQAPEIIENRVYAISEDSEGRMWFGMDTKGIQIFEYGTGFYLLTHDSADSQSISGNAIEKILLGNNGDVWVGTTRTGLNQHKVNTEKFTHLKNRTNTLIRLLGNDVISMAVDDYNRLWLGTFGEGWAVWNKKKQKIHYITAKNGLAGNHPTDIVIGDSGFIWLFSEVGITKVNAKTLQVVDTFTNHNSGFAGRQVSSAIDDKKGNIWFGHANGGLGRLSKSDNTFKAYNTRNSQVPSDIIDDLILSPSGDIWIASRSGLALYSPLKNKFTHYPEHHDGRNFYFNDLSLDASGSLWMSSPDGIHKFNISERLYENDVVLASNEPAYKSLIDTQGFSWISTNHGLLRLATDNTPSIRLTKNDGVQGGEFNGGVGVIMEDGALVFGGSEGVTIFNPNSISAVVNKVNITQMLIQSAADNDTVMLNNVPDSLNLPSNSLGLTLSLSSLNFDSVNEMKFRYREVNGKWIPAQTNKIYIPANKSGDFSFEFSSTNSLGEWQEPSEKLAISIASPWYLNIFAIIFYMAATILVIYIAYKLRVSRLKEKAHALEKLVKARTTELALSNAKITKQAEELQLVAVHKTHLFETISHELRTPITLILGPARQLNKQITDKNLSATAHLIERNATRLNHLVNQLLDLSRSESAVIKTPDSSVDLSKIVRNLTESFKPYALDAGISLNLDCHDDAIVPMSYDDAEKLVSNLLSNAIKYSRFNDDVLITVSQQYHTATLTFIDTGIGIANEHIDEIFTRFYRVNAEQAKTIEGSGIGLSIVNSIVKNANGKIKVSSELGAGTTFTVELPLSKNAHVQQRRASDQPTKQPVVKSATSRHNVEKPHLLLIDDNEDILIYVSSILSSHYKITTAINGADGIQQAKDIIPDIIISDVMMPGIDGLELLDTLKNDELTNHIPIIMLTAKGGSKITGLKLRADDYIAKPFDEDELPIKLRNLLATRDIIKQKFIIEYGNQSSNEPTSLQSQSTFINKLDSIIEQHYQNCTFSVAELAKEAAVSERQLLRKLKAETNIGAKEYIRVFRLKKAATLMMNGNTVSFTANEVGFSSQAYFSSCFKAFYNQTPSQFANNKPVT